VFPCRDDEMVITDSATGKPTYGTRFKSPDDFVFCDQDTGAPIQKFDRQFHTMLRNLKMEKDDKRCDGSKYVQDSLMAEGLDAPGDDHLAATEVAAKLVVECGDTFRPVHAALAVARAGRLRTACSPCQYLGCWAHSDEQCASAVGLRKRC